MIVRQNYVCRLQAAVSENLQTEFVRMCRSTEVPHDMVQDFLQDMTQRFNAATYNLLSNNCNNFSEEMAQLLVGSGIPVRTAIVPCVQCAAVSEGRRLVCLTV